VIFW